MGNEGIGFSTKAIHSGDDGKNIISPIFQTSIFKHPNGEKIRGKDLKYSREDNPTVHLLEQKVASLEGAEDCLAFSSGMAAISTAFLGLASKGDEVLTSKEVYGASLILLRSLKKFGLEVKCVLNEELVNSIKPSTKFVFVETITNPTLSVPDLPEIIKASRENSATLIVDNTFATPVNLRPLEIGADFVVHSATKYLGGHNDVISGVLSGSTNELEGIWEWRRNLGGSLDPFAAYLVMRGLKTLKLRVLEHNKNATLIAQFLEDHKKVRRVNYPGLVSSPYNRRAKRFMSGFGGVVSFEVGDGIKAYKLISELKMIKPAPSLGGVETLITHPASSSHKNISAEERRELGIAEGLVRLSVGLEDVEDIMRDLGEALEKI